MALDDIVTPQGILFDLKAGCKREALRALCDRAAEVTGLPDTDLLSAVTEREKLGSTGVGDGVAIPHGKIASVAKITGLFARLAAPVEFEALDEEPVDLIFLLLAPENATAAHLKALAKVSRHFRDPETRAALRGAETPEALFAIIAHDQTSDAA
ncbi:MAG: PTS sugar transporter subunit IIA [Pseudomonadota bacterium]